MLEIRAFRLKCYLYIFRKTHLMVSFSPLFSLEMAVRYSRTGKYPFTCSICGEHFFHKSRLKLHALTHNGQSNTNSVCMRSCVDFFTRLCPQIFHLLPAWFRWPCVMSFCGFLGVCLTVWVALRAPACLYYYIWPSACCFAYARLSTPVSVPYALPYIKSALG